MPQQTENQPITKPDYNSEWYQIGNDNWDYIDSRLIIRAPESDLSTYEPLYGAVFVATDTGAVFDGTGASWAKADRQFDRLTAATADIATLAGALTNGASVSTLDGPGLVVSSGTLTAQSASGLRDYATGETINVAITTDPSTLATPPDGEEVLVIDDS